MKLSEKIREWDSWDGSGGRRPPYQNWADTATQLESTNAALKQHIIALRANTSKSVLRRLDVQLEETE